MPPGEKVSCEECYEEWEGQPPCEECKKPKGMNQGNYVATKAWRLCNLSGRDINGNIKIESVTAALEWLNGLHDDLEKVITLDRIWVSFNGKTDKSETDG